MFKKNVVTSLVLIGMISGPLYPMDVLPPSAPSGSALTEKQKRDVELAKLTGSGPKAKAKADARAALEAQYNAYEAAINQLEQEAAQTYGELHRTTESTSVQVAKVSKIVAVVKAVQDNIYSGSNSDND